MNNQVVLNIVEAIMPIKDDSVNVTIVTASGKIARDFISRRVAIIDNDYHEVD